MNQFLAILRDSFREAVDGFVIYAMLALSALTIFIVGSMSFTPVEPQDAFDHIAGRFNVIIPERGRSRTISFSTNTTYKATEVTPVGEGYKLRLMITAKPNTDTIGTAEKEKGDEKEPKEKLEKGDSFRTAVAQWSNKSGQIVSVDMNGKRGGKSKDKSPEFSMPTQASTEDQLAITTRQMEEFLASQFEDQAGITATVQRVTTGFAEPTYAFDVTTANRSGVRGWPHTVKIFFGSVTVSKQAPLGAVLYFIEDWIINSFGAAIALLTGIVITAFFVPNMLRKGSVDLLISKPIGRTPLLVYKYIGGLTFMFLVTAFTVGGTWLAIALRSGFWDPTFLVLIPILTFAFAILYSVSVMVGVFTRSPIVAMLVTIGFMFLLYVVRKTNTLLEQARAEGGEDDVPRWLSILIDTLTTILPRYGDLETISSKLIVAGTLTTAESRLAPAMLLPDPNWASTIGVSLAFIAVMLALACWRFKRRDS